MEKKDLIKRELNEIESILAKKSYSQLLSLYHKRLFSDVEGLTGEDVEEIKEKLDSIADQLEEVTNTEAVSDEETVEVTDEVSDTDETSETEVTEDQEIGDTEQVDETVETEETEESVEEPAIEETSEEVETAEEVEDAPAEETTEVEEVEVPTSMVDIIESIDAELEELKEAVGTKDFSKVIARAHSRLFSAIEEHQDLIENIEEVKKDMDDLADKLEEMDAEDAEVAEDAEEVADKMDDEEKEVKTESECGLTVYFEDGTRMHYASEEEWKEDQEKGTPAVDHIEKDKCMSDEETEQVTDEVVEVPAETAEENAEAQEENEETIEAVAQQAAEEAVEEYMENSLYLNEPDESMDISLIDEVNHQPEVEVEPMYIDEKTDMVMDVEDADKYSEEIDDMDDTDTELFLEEDNYCDHKSTFTKEFSIANNEVSEYNIADIDSLLGI